MRHIIRRKIFEVLDRTAHKVLIHGVRSGRFNAGSGLRDAARSAWAPPAVYHNKAVIAEMDRMAAEFPVMSRERVLAEQSEAVSRHHLRALEAYRDGRKDDALAIFFQEFAPSEAEFLAPFAQDAALAQSGAPRDDIIALLRECREMHRSYDRLTNGEAFSPAEWRVAIIAHTLSHYADLSDKAALAYAADNLEDFVVGAGIAKTLWGNILKNTRYTLDPTVQEDPATFKAAYEIAHKNARNLTYPRYHHGMDELVDLGKNAERFADKMTEAQAIDPIQLRLGLPERFGTAFFADMDAAILPRSVREHYATPLDAFNANGDDKRTMAFIHISVEKDWPIHDDEEADLGM